MIAVGVLFLIYFTGIHFFAGHGTNFYFIWLAAGILLIMAGVCMKKGILIPHIPIIVKRLFLLGATALGVLFVFAECFIISGFSAKGEPGLDYLIVLGAQIKESGPSRVLQLRLDKAYEYLIENKETKVIVSGGQGSNEPISEAAGMYRYLIEKGIKPERIIMEDQSVNTFQNLKFSALFLNKETDRVGVVTNNFHIFRGTGIAKRAGYKNVCGIAAKSEASMMANNILREFAGVMKDWLVGNL